MKYIRTKDVVVEAKQNEVGAWVSKLPYKIFDRDIIAQATAIEELCDEFVIYQKGFLTPETSKVPLEEIDEWYGEDNEYRERVIYGAIWTTGEHGEPILKSVAKMNNKGELELL